MGIRRDAVALRLPSGLQSRRMGFGHLLPQAGHAAVVVGGGRADLMLGDERISLPAHSIGWARLVPGAAISQEAGSPALILGVTDQALIEATSDAVDAPMLRSFEGRSFAVDCTGRPAELREITFAIEGLIREGERAERGSRLLISGYLRVILVGLWRLSGIEPEGEATVGQARAVLIRFRELVEVHLRDRWRIADYAQAIGVTGDRLHALTTRELGRTPLELLHDRLNFEARRHLLRAALSIEQVSHALGFRDPAHFSAFFKRLNGVSPAGFRKRQRADFGARREEAAASYADWP